jgi:hypothetical protein
MKLLIDRHVFIEAYHLKDEESYDKFLRKINVEFDTTIHPSLSVVSFEPTSKQTDVGSNIHVVWTGQISGWQQKAEFGGEFVWLQRLSSFRGKLWSRLENFTDEQLLMLARNELRLGRQAGAKNYIDAIQHIEDLPQSALLLKSKIEKGTGFVE